MVEAIADKGQRYVVQVLVEIVDNKAVFKDVGYYNEPAIAHEALIDELRRGESAKMIDRQVKEATKDAQGR